MIFITVSFQLNKGGKAGRLLRSMESREIEVIIRGRSGIGGFYEVLE